MKNVPIIQLNRDQYLELEKISFGAFNPLSGFMDEAQFRSVTESMRLPEGDVFPVPVVLDISERVVEEIKDSDEVELEFSGKIVGKIKPHDIYKCDRKDSSKKIFGTADPNHPGVEYFLGLESYFVGGQVELTERVYSNISDYELTPSQTREEFRNRGWQHIAGFQTRNVPHRAHEYLQRTALEMVDGLFLQPLVGRKRRGDFTPNAILCGYAALVGPFLPADRVVTGILSTFMRYAGPREAVFHAIVRRNYGCTHFIVGRDHAGVGDWYGAYDAHELTRRFEGDLGIEIMPFRGPYYCQICDGIVTDKTCPHTNGLGTTSISGTDMRQILLGGNKPNPKLMRPEIVNALQNKELFIK